MTADDPQAQQVDDDDLIETAAGGMRMSCYLPPRTFELAVHRLDGACSEGAGALVLRDEP